MKVKNLSGAGREPRTLASAVRQVITISLIVSGCFFAATGMADTTDTRGTTNLPPVDAVPPFEVPPYDPPTLPGVGHDPDSGEGSGGTPSTPGESAQQRFCRSHLAIKPASCPNPIPFPSGADYAQNKLPGASWGAKSTVLMSIALSQGRTYGLNRNVPPDPQAQETMRYILERQTQNYANPTKNFDSANGEFRAGLEHVCELQAQASSNYRLGRDLTIPEIFCFQIMKAFEDEVRGAGFVETFVEWGRRYGIPVEEYITPQWAGSVELEKSLMAKWQQVSADASCSNWWTTLQQNQCSIP